MYINEITYLQKINKVPLSRYHWNFMGPVIRLPKALGPIAPLDLLLPEAPKIPCIQQIAAMRIEWGQTHCPSLALALVWGSGHCFPDPTQFMHLQQA